jgi:hypothetical protein
MLSGEKLTTALTIDIIIPPIALIMPFMPLPGKRWIGFVETRDRPRDRPTGSMERPTYRREDIPHIVERHVNFLAFLCLSALEN